MKKIVCVLLALVMVLGITGCGSSSASINTIEDVLKTAVIVPRELDGAWTNGDGCAVHLGSDGYLDFDDNGSHVIHFRIESTVKNEGNNYYYKGNNYDYTHDQENPKEKIGLETGGNCKITFNMFAGHLYSIKFEFMDATDTYNLNRYTGTYTLEK